MLIKLMLQVQYLVKWVGWEEETWEPELNLAGSEILISDYQTSQAAGSKDPTVLENLNNCEKPAVNEEEGISSELLSSKGQSMQLAAGASTVDPSTSTDETTLANTFQNHDAVENGTIVGQTETENPLKMTANVDSAGTSRELVPIGENMKSDQNGGKDDGIGGNANGTNCETDVSENPPTAN